MHNEKNPFNEIARIVDSHTKKQVTGIKNDEWMVAVMGTMTSNLDLLVDGMSKPISNYVLSDHLTLAEPDFTETEKVAGGSGEAQYESHSHPVKTPKQLYHLHPGDRVVAEPINGGQIFCIMCRCVERQ